MSTPLTHRPLHRETEALVALDPAFAPIVAQVGPCLFENHRAPTPFAELVRSIVYQQLSGKSASAIHQRFLALMPDAHPTASAILALDDPTLRGAGLSHNKIRALRDLATKSQAGLIPDTPTLATMGDTEIIDTLTQVRGIGPWTAQMLLIFYLGRLDIMPATDLGIQKGYQRLFQTEALPRPKELLAASERWRPYRSLAAWYLWRVKES